MSQGTTTTVLLAEGITKRYGEQAVLRGLDVRVHAGEVVALRGPNGSGKSTLLGCCSGSVIPDAGKVMIGGHPLATAPIRARQAMRILPQQSELPPGLTGEELLQFWAEVFGAEAADVGRARELVSLGDALSRLSTTYSVGMRRRLHFGVLAMGKSSLFLLDEPFAGVDGPSRGRLSAWLQAQARAGVGMLVAAHDADQAELEKLGARELRLAPEGG